MKLSGHRAKYDYIPYLIYHSTSVPLCKQRCRSYYITISLISKVTNASNSVEMSDHGGSVPGNEDQHGDEAMSSIMMML